ncbi:DUF58 domain-containing protein [Halosegnis marinus]|uniref:DUF58 domain-containing protein n=1 Tax=Halosegnis marinus TaxID=3034023 RepID=A0ABD5ZMM5_9EURY|nr:DUF58 domain-containing protein [Halosegnis sp. DT85]
MRPTRRGWGAVAVVALAVGFAAQSGPRSLNAVAAPALLALAFGYVTLHRRDAPTVERRKPAPGFPGETRDVILRVDAAGRASVSDASDGGVARVADTANGYRVELTDRGEWTLGPATVAETDAFGLLRRRTVAGGETEALVYPPVEPLAPNRAFRGLVERAGSPDRDAFDALREYVPGDPLRDVHWKTSAKRPPGDLVVAEFATQDEGGVTVVAESTPGRADAMAAAAASVAVHLLEADLSVAVVAPNGRVERGRGDDHRDETLELLARTHAGDVNTAVEADVRVRADRDGVTVRTEGREFPFSDLLGDADPVEDARAGVALA